MAESTAADARPEDGAGASPSPGEPRSIPLGFTGDDQYQSFVQTLSEGLVEAGFPGTAVVFQGSAVTGASFSEGRPFGPHSDYDIALAGPGIFGRAAELGIPTRSRRTRTGPLTVAEFRALGLADLRRTLRSLVGRRVSFMIYSELDVAVHRSESLIAQHAPTAEIPSADPGIEEGAM